MRSEQKNPFTNAKLIGFDIDPNEYHAMHGGHRGSREFIMSRGALADFAYCPSKWLSGYESRDTNATKWGSLLDTLVLSEKQFEKRFAVYPETYPVEPTTKDPRTEKPWNNNATYCKEWKKERDGVSFIYREKFADDGEADEDTKIATLGNATRSKARLLQDSRIAELIKCSRTQCMVTAEYHDKSTGIIVPFKTLLDLMPDRQHRVYGKALADYKTARNASEGAFKKAMHDGYYDWQAVIYRDCYVAATGEDRCDFLFAAQENTPPYEPALWAISCDWLDDARTEVVRALQFYCSCLASNTWPGYPITTPIESWGALSRDAYMLRNIQAPMPMGNKHPSADLHSLELTP